MAVMVTVRFQWPDFGGRGSSAWQVNCRRGASRSLRSELPTAEPDFMEFSERRIS
jgi:hypothetical protein